MTQIAFIGLGNMGGPMAANLVKAGHQVTAFDFVQAALDTFVEAGGVAASSAMEAIKDAQVVVSMLPAGKHVAGLYLGSEGLLANLPKDSLVVDSSTIDVETARRVGVEAKSLGIHFVDAPVSGGTAGAKAGTLSFIVGGDQTCFERAQPVLEAMGKNIFHAGDAGAGQIAKMCNNMLLSVLMAGTAEALQMGVENGLDPKVLSDIMVKSSGRNWALEIYNPVPGVMDGTPASNNYQGGFMVDLMNKDLGLALSAAQASNSNVPMGQQASQLFKAHGDAGYGGLDFSSIYQHYSNNKV
ncbi:MAG: 3-hydroxyisobutyrate dehydrogenase [Oceanospirillaceae bacterium]|jgi:3-hydroxyisobutyrate dehydrogenase|nr:3-hydroxyisobutyrate dehydrogenase [Oceanospirillaceae bacterium]MBT4442784.1 3-hydroxyisobutyrate dehydrogenase [Oceanospirillaceae bacterium]MBT6078104.1 3-hydroxyisobutyrate dehydrogenase [Oceanospirillaceae bacterium]MBT7330323.1 3-hydroxyisobutyrate dehydrogenase [Oceanospirillaceae bacterium]